VIPVMSGTKISTFVTVVLPQDKSSEDNVHAQLQQLSGMETHVSAHQTPSDQTVFHAQPQDSGTTPTVFALKTESGTDKTAFALLVFTDQTVNHAQPQEDG
jgi:hypothetical protein